MQVPEVVPKPEESGPGMMERAKNGAASAVEATKEAGQKAVDRTKEAGVKLKESVTGTPDFVFQAGVQCLGQA